MEGTVSLPVTKRLQRPQAELVGSWAIRSQLSSPPLDGDADTLPVVMKY